MSRPTSNRSETAEKTGCLVFEWGSQPLAKADLGRTRQIMPRQIARRSKKPTLLRFCGSFSKVSCGSFLGDRPQVIGYPDQIPARIGFGNLHTPLRPSRAVDTVPVGMSAATANGIDGDTATEVQLPSGKHGTAKFYTLQGVAAKVGRSRDSLHHRLLRGLIQPVAYLDTTGGEWPLFSEAQLEDIKGTYRE